MLSLEDPKWRSLRTAYGTGETIPPLIRALTGSERSSQDAEPWSSIWSSLAHQGDVYSASFAAAPHIIEILVRLPNPVPVDYYHFPAWVEICREKTQTLVDPALQDSYADAIDKLGRLAADATKQPPDEIDLPCILSAIAVAKKQFEMAEIILELSPGIARELITWFHER